MLKTPTTSPRAREKQRLRSEAQGTFAPAKPGLFEERRCQLIERHVQEGLLTFDQQDQQDQQETQLQAMKKTS